MSGPLPVRLTVGVLRVGLTGGIGAGKSEVARRLAGHGAVVVDADRLAREVVAPGTDGLAEVVARFGRRVLTADGGLDRAALAAVVFDDEAARRDLEAIIHPRVRARTAALVAAAPSDAVVVNDVPLLVEAGLADTYHLVLVVMAAEPVRVARLVADRGMSEAQALARIRAQADDAARAAAADVLVRNEGTLAELHARVDEVWRDRLVPFEANLRLARPAPAPGGRVPYDPQWPRQYARLAARVRRALGPAALRVDHVGPTAVPGTPAPDVIDILAVVADPDDAGLVTALAEAGFPAVDGGGTVRVCGNADPGRPARVELHAAGSVTWRDRLLVRDWLRADVDARTAYHERASVVEPVPESARRWADRTGWRPPD